MTRKQNLLITLGILLVLGVPASAQPAVPASAQPAMSRVWSQQCDGETRVRGTTVECWAEVGPPSTPTATAEPGSTATPEPTVTPTPEPGVSLCFHNPRVWHDVYDEGQGCRYDHEHGDDPSLVNDVFGPAGSWFGSPGWEIGSPAVPAHELTEGHRFWKTYAATGLTAADNNLVGSDGSYIRSFRVQTHVASDGDGIKHRYHGFTAEIEACRHEDTPRPGTVPKPVGDTSETCGLYRASGTLDYGNLFLRETGDPYRFLLPNAGDGQDAPLLFGQRIHSAIPSDTQAVWYPNSWPGTNGYLDLQVIISDGWSWADPGGGNQDVVIRQVGSGNGSVRQLHVLAVNIESWMSHDGQTFIDTFGNSDDTCATWHAGCGLLLLEDWPTDYQIRYAELVGWRHYDTSPEGEAWITSPN